MKHSRSEVTFPIVLVSQVSVIASSVTAGSLVGRVLERFFTELRKHGENAATVCTDNFQNLLCDA